MKGKPSKNIRLSKDITPSKYDVSFRVDLDAHAFSGEETIYLQNKKTTKKITLHSLDLNIESSYIVHGKDKVFPIKTSYDKKRETVTLEFKENIKPGKIKLVFLWRGVLSDTLRGFYKSTYLHDGKEKTMATTQFESTDARRAFPCFDEPDFKAVFNIKMALPKDKHAISNTLPISTSHHSDGYQVIEFSPTPKMSTYLVAFIIGDFEYIKRKTKRGVEVRVFTTPGKKNQAKFALDVAVRCLDFYEKYFEINYPLPNLDMIAIPDFEAGAMENWGAITYRESALLVDDENTALSNKQWVAIVICHELAHQWFGNLVTMEWWTDLWLNEGFASYIEYLAADHLFPEWKMWEQFVALDLSTALSLDSLENTHPIEVDVHDPKEIGEIFDAISYQKGASVIRMLAEYIGYENFRKGLAYYLKKHSYKNTSTIHLWEAFEKVSKKPVKKMMHTWTHKAGHPLVSVDLNKGKFLLSQRRFYSSMLSAKKSKDTTVWPVPMTYMAENENKRHSVFFDKKNMSIDISHEDKWYKWNADETGVYRVDYSPTLLEKLFIPVKDKKITKEDRHGILRDISATTFSSTGKVKDMLEFLHAYKKEDEYIVWSQIISILLKMDNILHGTKYHSALHNYAREILEDIVKKVGFKKKNSESHSQVLLRSLVLGAGARFGMKDIASFANKNINKKGLDPDMRGVVYGSVVRDGNNKTLNNFIQMYKAESFHEEKNRIGGAMAHFRDEKILEKVLDFVFSDAVRPQDKPMIFYRIASSPYGRKVAWVYLKKNWKKIIDIYSSGGHMLVRFVSPFSSFIDDKYAKEIKEFFKKNPAPGAKRTIMQSVEAIEANAAFYKANKKEIENFFKRYI
ncbi:M1 family metallopeptidase [Candidatus Nomurabacteria bacterium]|nr:M1 family metallopeptidase [Candidatus Nomurabacteria bacterium]